MKVKTARTEEQHRITLTRSLLKTPLLFKPSTFLLKGNSNPSGQTEQNTVSFGFHEASGQAPTFPFHYNTEPWAR